MSAVAAVTLRQAEALVGLNYDARHFDCAHLAVLAQAKLFGRVVAAQLPKSHPVRPLLQHRLLSELRDELATRIDAPEMPVSGDVVLFKEWLPVAHGSCLESWHIGTLLLEYGERWVLHTHAGVGRSVLERLTGCAARGLRPEGFYRWKVVA